MNYKEALLIDVFSNMYNEYIFLLLSRFDLLERVAYKKNKCLLIIVHKCSNLEIQSLRYIDPLLTYLLLNPTIIGWV
jgi:hypothetical protein